MSLSQLESQGPEMYQNEANAKCTGAQHSAVYRTIHLDAMEPNVITHTRQCRTKEDFSMIPDAFSCSNSII